jgi:inner membrane protein involved in colicin E2 resistance
MRILNFRNCFFTSIFLFGIQFSGFSQTGQVNVQQNEILPELLQTKSQMTKDGKLGDRYKIQLYYGDNNAASEVIKEYRSKYTSWPSEIIYETPNYKVWIGNFRNRREADKVLLQIKQDFPAAFIPKPQRG